jgi:LysM repeat protein
VEEERFVTSSIGIKIANGEFYPILDENARTKKRLVLTTVHDGQQSTQIDLYRSETRSMTDAQPIGSLVVEKIKSRKKGEPSVELLVSVDADGEFSAEAKDLDNPKREENSQLTVSLKSLKQKARDILPDFDLDPQDSLNDSDFDEDSVNSDASTWDAKKKPPVLVIVVAAAVLAALLFSVWYFLLDGKAKFDGGNGTVESETAAVEPPAPPPPLPPPPVEQTPPPPVQPPPIVRPPDPPPVATANTSAASRKRPTPPVRSYKVPALIPKGGVKYKIRWGDTLWDVAEAFYRNPYRYSYLARWNGIKNPNRIISGTTITIPPR